jgi:hypothetical protein
MEKSTKKLPIHMLLRLDLGDGEQDLEVKVFMLICLLLNRICPGRHMSLDSLYAMISATLAVFDISPPKDENGNTKTLNPIYSDGLLWCALFIALAIGVSIDCTV